MRGCLSAERYNKPALPHACRRYDVNEALLTGELTTEEFLDLPEEDGVERLLIDGELFEEPMSERNSDHSRITARICYLLERGLEPQPEPRGKVLGGDAGFRIRRMPDT